MASSDVGGAIEDFATAIRRDADYAEAYHQRGLAYRLLGEEAKSRSDLAEAHRLNPHAVDEVNDQPPV